VIDPEYAFGLPSVRAAATESIAELYRAGDATELLAEVYGLPLADINAAIAYETHLAATDRQTSQFFVDENSLALGLCSPSPTGMSSIRIFPTCHSAPRMSIGYR
jgi:uncharacterized protein (DUF433 family)